MTGEVPNLEDKLEGKIELPQDKQRLISFNEGAIKSELANEFLNHIYTVVRGDEEEDEEQTFSYDYLRRILPNKLTKNLEADGFPKEINELYIDALSSRERSLGKEVRSDIDAEKLQKKLYLISSQYASKFWIAAMDTKLDGLSFVDLSRLGATLIEERLAYMRNDDMADEVLNYMCTVTHDGGSTGLHIKPSFGFSEKEKKEMIYDALEKIKLMFERDESLENIWIASWIVKFHPKLISSFGFEISNEPKDDGYYAYLRREAILKSEWVSLQKSK